MRLWSIHPKYLDGIGLVAVWREGLLAKKVLEGETRGYRNHPELERFKEHREPQRAINAYLCEIWKEAKRRNYDFDKSKFVPTGLKERIPIDPKRVSFEFGHLLKKLKMRSPEKYREIRALRGIEVNPVFEVSDKGVC